MIGGFAVQQETRQNFDENILRQITQRPVTYHQVAPDILLLEFPFVNAFMVGSPDTKGGEWALIGAGMANTGRDILYAAEQLNNLADNFSRLAVPQHKRWVH
jgi:hypothetical protein